jgi:UDP-glucuronate 4-epimerase
MSTYLVSGAAGFIGARVTELLLRENHNVYGIDNLDNYYDPLLKQRRLDNLHLYPTFRFLKGNIQDPFCLRTLCEDATGFDAAIHLAARAGVRPSVADPVAYVETNVLGTLNVLQLCREYKIHKLVIASSSSVYGSHNPMPYSEDADTSRPLSPYAATKKATEELCFTYHHLYKLDISALRFFTVYGPAGRPDMSMFRFVRGIVEGTSLTLFGDGTQLRDFSFVDDIARGTISALKLVGFRAFNLGANHPVQLNTVIETIERLTKRRAVIDRKPADPTDVPATWANVSRANTELGWQPQASLEDGICQTVQWYLANRDWASQIHNS